MPSNELIQRRLKVIELADKGLTNKEIANELGISTSTVSSDKKAYHKNPNAYKKTVKKTTTTTTSKPSKPANKQTITNENKTTTASTANNTVNASTANNTVKTTDKTVKTAHDDTVSTTADNDKTLPAVNTDTTKNDGTAKIKETAATNTISENTVNNADIDSNNSNSSNAINVNIDSNSSISGDDIVNDVNDMMDKAIHDFQGKLHNIAVEARKEMGLPTDTAPEYGNESPSDNSQSDADNANITPANTTNTMNTESDGNSDNVSNANNVNTVSANTSTSRLVKSHVVSPDNIITNSGIITGINNSSQHSYDHSIIANMIGSNDTNAYNVFKNLNDREKWDAKEQEKSNSYVRGFLTGGFIIAIIGILLNMLF